MRLPSEAVLLMKSRRVKSFWPGLASFWLISKFDYLTMGRRKLKCNLYGDVSVWCIARPHPTLSPRERVSVLTPRENSKRLFQPPPLCISLRPPKIGDGFLLLSEPSGSPSPRGEGRGEGERYLDFS